KQRLVHGLARFAYFLVKTLDLFPRLLGRFAKLSTLIVGQRTLRQRACRRRKSGSTGRPSGRRWRGRFFSGLSGREAERTRASCDQQARLFKKMILCQHTLSNYFDSFVRFPGAEPFAWPTGCCMRAF